MTDSDIITEASQNPLLRFNMDGKFLNFIGRYGRGPGEYLPGSSFTINPDSNIIFVNRNFLHDYICFNLEGNYLGKFPLNFNNSVHSFEILPKSRFAFFPAYDGREVADNIIRQNMFLIGLFERNGNKLIEISNPAKNIPANFNPSKYIPGPPYFNTYFNNEVVTQCFDNLVYKINSDTIYTGYIIEWGDLNIPKTFEEKYYSQSATGKTFDHIRSRFVETLKDAYFILKNGNNRYLLDYNKSSGNTKSMLLEDKVGRGFLNDLDGGLSFFPVWTNRRGDIWIDCIDAYSMSLTKTNDLIKKSELINPRSKGKLNDFIKNLKSDDNPVLRLVYLKKK